MFPAGSVADSAYEFAVLLAVLEAVGVSVYVMAPGEVVAIWALSR